jgi:hypothetical protein
MSQTRDPDSNFRISIWLKRQKQLGKLTISAGTTSKRTLKCSEKAESARRLKLEGSSNDKSEIASHSINAQSQIISTEAGMETDRRETHLAKALPLIFRRREPLSKCRSERDAQPEKESSERIATDAGMQIDRRQERSVNVPSCIRPSFEPCSKVTADSEVQFAKQQSPRSSTEAGMQTDRSDVQESKAWLSIR